MLAFLGFLFVIIVIFVLIGCALGIAEITFSYTNDNEEEKTYKLGTLKKHKK